MYIRESTPNDIERIMQIYSEGRTYMRKNGNMLQWNDGYPSEELIRQDIKNRVSFVVCDDNDEIICVFAFIKGPDITYAEIYHGNWPNDNDYYVIHRIAVSTHRKGVAGFVYDYCLSKANTVRIDTHRDNIPMQNSLNKYGFTYCGIIHLLNGDERLAYQKERTNI